MFPPYIQILASRPTAKFIIFCSNTCLSFPHVYFNPSSNKNTHFTNFSSQNYCLLFLSCTVISWFGALIIFLILTGPTVPNLVCFQIHLLPSLKYFYSRRKKPTKLVSLISKAFHSFVRLQNSHFYRSWGWHSFTWISPPQSSQVYLKMRVKSYFIIVFSITSVSFTTSRPPLLLLGLLILRSLRLISSFHHWTRFRGTKIR